MPKRKRYTLSYIKSTPWEELSKLNATEVKRVLSDTRGSINKRIKSLSEFSEEHFSYALDKLETHNFDNISKYNRNQLVHELAVVKDFLDSVTSTRRGVLSVEREQDARIFGKTQSGKNRKSYHMSNEDRKVFWHVYDEFLNQNANADALYKSATIQQMLGEIHNAGLMKAHLAGDSVSISQDDISRLKSMLEANSRGEDYQNLLDPNKVVYSEDGRENT